MDSTRQFILDPVIVNSISVRTFSAHCCEYISEEAYYD